ncbi:MAG: sigma-70 family RNA polymerase sigma factor [Bacteroidota bacterium]|nr:sigma-70 family RNA polymerase sigma factor [Bacteroidota bacterium]MDP3147285.1 sigma-70 family RNA polymerase sigma factor [Bacteroidota bacterium]MDP3557341.1 sigma-70 family RNA polymerase sigma factor [Bacteroidota bacterium]
MSIQLLNDNELVQLYIGGNEESLSVLLTRHKRKIFSSIMVVVKNKALAEDIFQDTFFKVIQTLKRGQYSEEGKFLPWVIRIARNLIIDHFRRIKKMPPVPVYINDEGEEVSVFSKLSSEEENVNTEETLKFKKNIRSIINELPKDQREVVIMRTYYDMSFKEIADFTNVSINTALGRMRYGLLNLKKMIEEKNLEVSLG